ncbi:crotonobetainyl-CoA:carnitine CoA-transferase CaiB-like acyl-CoA transferase [Caldalkalibacillus uzonensis]|uniref:Crotonobetainyl-CoA:carnitine CoA-transferase CaiB-like acyl-CoA transferase n=1 Tax=Caldalkalibacillus uzonensis TaxID=353224 RepID=A0ABU0CQL9_9BACI|nr:CoA transferase [Caldalkalibacillus uzonensis]MDQ0338191.1 crotonobetainyl-CoA:carnitine CoA-transferase CaiB-like acyl-CoA transferase [Caldalkalibacillus uzonensis]
MRPLDGIRVIDLSRILSGPYCTMTLADLGAEVIKVEPPNGDDTRGWGPPFVVEESAYFLSVNRNKKSIVLNLKTEEGREIFLKMVKEADVVVENFRPGTLDRLKIGYDVLKEVNPRIILASISGYGQTGPYRNKPGYDVIAQGVGGLTSVTGEPGRPPVKAGFSIADIGTGMWAVIGIQSALIAREKTGQGQWIDVSLLDTMISWQTYLAGNYFASGKDPEPQGGAHPNIVPYQLFESADGYFNVAVGNDSLWAKFCQVIGEEELIDHPKYKTNADRVRHREELIPYLQNIFLKRTSKEWVEAFEEAGIPAGPVLKLSEIFTDPHVLAREQLVEVEHPTAGKVKMTGIPVKLSDTPGEIKDHPPLLGQHTEEILTKYVGLEEKKIKELAEKNIVKVYNGQKVNN